MLILEPSTSWEGTPLFAGGLEFSCDILTFLFYQDGIHR